jgi:hypothetical protein
LSKLAAKSSTLRVGLGLNATGDIALTHAQLPEDRALIRGHIRAGAAGSASSALMLVNWSKCFPSAR